MNPQRFDIERGIGFEDALFALFEACNPDRDNSWREYGVKFENETFSTYPDYQDEKCTCGYESKEFYGGHKYSCYDKEVDRELLRVGWKQQYSGSWFNYGEFFLELVAPNADADGFPSNRDKEIRDSIRERLCAKHGLAYPQGCAIHCTCGRMDRLAIWEESIGYPGGHKPECDLERPNFLFKPTGLRIEWYKYPLRDAYSNQEITVDEFKKNIAQCIKSLGKDANSIFSKPYDQYRAEKLAKLNEIVRVVMKDYEGPPIKIFMDI
jgi:hypothetical protein